MFARLTLMLNRIGPYGLASATQAGSSFLILPILIMLLGTESYGRFALLEPLIATMAQVLLLGVHQGLLHAICKEGVSPISGLKITILKSHIFLIPLSCATFFIVYLWQHSIKIATLFAFSLYLEAINLLFLTTIRAVAKSWFYFYSVFTRSSCMLLIIASATFLGWSCDESFALLAILISIFLSITVLAFSLSGSRDSICSQAVNPEIKLFKFIRYGLPLVCSGFGQTIISIADRYILNLYVPSSIITAYVVSLKLANIINLVATPVNLWWPTARFQHLNDSDGGNIFFRNALIKVGAIYAIVSISVIVAAPYLLNILGPKVNTDINIAAMLVIATFLQAIQVIFNVGLLNQGHTIKTLYISAFVAILHVSGCAFLIPKFSTYGAAIMSILSALIFLVLIHITSQKVVKVSQNLKVFFFEFSSVLLAALILITKGSVF